MSLTNTDAENIELGVEEGQKRMYGPMTGKVVAYDSATRTVDVQPMVKRAIERLDGSLLLETLPVLPSVPVVFPMSGDFSITYPVAVGSYGLIIVLSDSDHIWRETQLEAEPGDLRRFHLGCSRFLPGYAPDAVAMPAAAENALVLRAPEVRLGDETATDFVALSPAVEARLTAIETWLPAHVHAGVTAGPGSTGVAAGFVADTAQTAATKVKAI